MGQHVVSTKLSDEEHAKLIELCRKSSCTPSALIKQAVAKWIELESSDVIKEQKSVSSKGMGQDKIFKDGECSDNVSDVYFQYFRNRIDSR